MGQQPGILAIWQDCRAGREAEFEAWFQGEHLEERLAVPGFLFGRRHEAVSGAPGYFNFYVVERPEALTSQAYLERLDNPTPMTRKVMSEIFLNMNRTVCRRVARRGAFRGAFVVTVRFSEPPDSAALAAQLETLTDDHAIAGGELWLAADLAGQSVSSEEKLRGGDRKIAGCLMLDTLRQAEAERLGERLKREHPKAEVGVFRVLCTIGRADI